jgi:hypothetical protein
MISIVVIKIHSAKYCINKNIRAIFSEWFHTSLSWFFNFFFKYRLIIQSENMLLHKECRLLGVAPCRCSGLNRRFGGTCRLHLQGRKIRERRTSVSRWLQSSHKSKTPSYIWAGGEGEWPQWNKCYYIANWTSDIEIRAVKIFLFPYFVKFTVYRRSQ